MGLRGPKRITDEEAKRRGYRRPKKRNKGNRKFLDSKPGAPIVPESMKENPQALAMWKALEKKLLKAKVLTPDDGSVFEGLVKSYLQAVEADRLVQKHGMVMETHFGLKANPAVMMSRKAWKDVLRFSAEFGLSPVSRARVGSTSGVPEEGSKEKQAEQEAEEMLFGKVVGAIKPRVHVK